MDGDGGPAAVAKQLMRFRAVENEGDFVVNPREREQRPAREQELL
jgi:hypothetical protein